MALITVILFSIGKNYYCSTFFFSMAFVCHWLLHQLNVDNIFLHGDLEEEIHMKQPLGFVV